MPSARGTKRGRALRLINPFRRPLLIGSRRMDLAFPSLSVSSTTTERVSRSRTDLLMAGPPSLRGSDVASSSSSSTFLARNHFLPKFSFQDHEHGRGRSTLKRERLFFTSSQGASLSLSSLARRAVFPLLPSSFVPSFVCGERDRERERGALRGQPACLPLLSSPIFGK